MSGNIPRTCRKTCIAQLDIPRPQTPPIFEIGLRLANKHNCRWCNPRTIRSDGSTHHESRWDSQPGRRVSASARLCQNWRTRHPRFPLELPFSGLPEQGSQNSARRGQRTPAPVKVEGVLDFDAGGGSRQQTGESHNCQVNQQVNQQGERRISN